MKKLLTLVLVLAVASLANAGLSISYDGAAITLSSDTALDGGLNNILGIIGDAQFGDFTLRTENVPNTAAVITMYTGTEAVGMGLPYTGQFVTVLWSNGGDDILTPSPAGFWLSAALSGYTLGTEISHDIQIDLGDGNANPMQSIYLTAVPEPITMALLGVGGLFLRRKK